MPEFDDYWKSIIDGLIRRIINLESKLQSLESRLSLTNLSLVKPEYPIIHTESSYPKALPPLNSDVSNETWDYTAIRLLQLNDIMIGYDDNTFRGDKPATRSELASSLFCLITRILKPELLSEPLP